MSPIDILIVEDSPEWRDLITLLLAGKPHLRVVCAVSDGLDGVQKAQELQPDVILLDISLPGVNGIEAARMIRERSPRSKILFVSGSFSEDFAEAAFSTGARGFVVKSDTARELLPAVEAVIQGRTYMSSRLGTQHFIESEPASEPRRSFKTTRLPGRNSGQP